MALQYSHRPLNGDWPGPRTSDPVKSPFRGANWSGTLGLLEHELRQLDATDVVFVLNVDSRQVNLDGRLRADARVKDPGVIVEFKVGPDRLSFPCDTYNHWHENLRAIALALEALRKVDRYGVRKGSQYEGFKALPGAGGSSTTMSVHAAAAVIAEVAQEDFTADELWQVRDAARDAVRVAQGRAHPDRHGGDTRAFQRVMQAKQVLTAHFGGAL